MASDFSNIFTDIWGLVMRDVEVRQVATFVIFIFHSLNYSKGNKEQNIASKYSQKVKQLKQSKM